MERVLQTLADSSWWFSNVLVALIVSVAAVPAHAYLSRTLSNRASKRQVASILGRAKFNADLDLMKLHPERATVTLIELHEMGMFLLGTLFVLFTMIYLAIAAGSQPSLIARIANLLGPIGAGLFALGTYRKYLRLSVLLSTYKQWVLSKPAVTDA